MIFIKRLCTVSLIMYLCYAACAYADTINYLIDNI
jgi:hypothetical protein